MADAALPPAPTIDIRQRVQAQARRLRRVKLIDRLAVGFITFGGLFIIVAVLFIFVFIFGESLPLFRPASGEAKGTVALAAVPPLEYTARRGSRHGRPHRARQAPGDGNRRVPAVLLRGALGRPHRLLDGRRPLFAPAAAHVRGTVESPERVAQPRRRLRRPRDRGRPRLAAAGAVHAPVRGPEARRPRPERARPRLRRDRPAGPPDPPGRLRGDGRAQDGAGRAGGGHRAGLAHGRRGSRAPRRAQDQGRRKGHPRPHRPQRHRGRGHREGQPLPLGARSRRCA